MITHIRTAYRLIPLYQVSTYGSNEHGEYEVSDWREVGNGGYMLTPADLLYDAETTTRMIREADTQEGRDARGIYATIILPRSTWEGVAPAPFAVWWYEHAERATKEQHYEEFATEAEAVARLDELSAGLECLVIARRHNSMAVNK